MTPYRTGPQLIQLTGMMDTVFLQIAFGFIITTIFQSGSVTTGLVVVMTQNGLITPTVAIPILLGANPGTPTTSLLVATRMNTSAKRAAVAHFIITFSGVLLFPPYRVVHLVRRVAWRCPGVAGCERSFDLQSYVLHRIPRPDTTVRTAGAPGSAREG